MSAVAVRRCPRNSYKLLSSLVVFSLECRSAFLALPIVSPFLSQLDSDPGALLADLDATLTALVKGKRRSDGTTRRLNGIELEEGTGFGANNIQLLDWTKSVNEGVSKYGVGHILQHVLENNPRIGSESCPATTE